jgi:hypothetical protein
MIYLFYNNFYEIVNNLHIQDVSFQIRHIFQVIRDIERGIINSESLLWKHYKKSLVKLLALYLYKYDKKHTKFPSIYEHIEMEEYSDSIPNFMTNTHHNKIMYTSTRVLLLRNNYEYYSKLFPKLANQDINLYPYGLFLPVYTKDYEKTILKWIKFYKNKYPHVYELSNLVQKRRK